MSTDERHEKPDAWVVGDECGGHIEWHEFHVKDAATHGWSTVPLYMAATVTRIEQEAYRRGQVDAAQRVIAAWDAGWTAGASRQLSDNPYRADENGGRDGRG